MPTNIEIKARARDPGALHEIAAQLSGGAGAVLEQEDVFFHAARGRLKLRMFSPVHGELIAYRREDRSDVRASEYTIAPTTDPQAVRAVLGVALGERVVVRKRRTLHLVGQTRIHLDEVEGLGSFVELEYVLRPGEAPEHGEQETARLLALLGVGPADFVSAAYADLIAGS